MSSENALVKNPGAFWQPSAKTCILLAVTAIVLYLTVLPLLMVIYGTFVDGPPGTRVSFTLANYARAFGNVALVYSALNSIAFAAGSALISFVVGCYLAWVTERTNTPGKSVIYGCVFLLFLIPGILTTISWVFLLSPKIGAINVAAKALFGFSSPVFDVYSFSGMIWVFGIDHITLPFLLMAAAFRSMDPTLEEAAALSTMGPFRSFYHINMKLMLPSIFAVLLLLFVRGIETFEAPAVIGIPAGIKVFATDIFLALQDAPTDYNLASTYAMVYLAVTVIGIVLYLRATKAAERFATITGKGYRPHTVDLRNWKYLTSAIALLILFVAVFLPVGMIIWMSFMPYYAMPSWRMLGHASFDNYRMLFELDSFSRALVNNLIAGGVSATIAVLLSVGVAWIAIRTKFRGRYLLDVLAFSPIAIPGVVMGLALLMMYLALPIPIYGTLWLLIVAYVTKFIPISLRAVHASMLQVHRDLEEAAEISGASWTRNTFEILLPLIIPGLLVGWLYVLTLTFKVLSIPILLSHVGTEVLPVLIYGLYESGEHTQLCALGVVLSLLIATIAGLIKLISNRFAVDAGE